MEYPITKGDLLGHIFHGNQHTRGAGGSAPVRQIDTGRFHIEPGRFTAVGVLAQTHALKPSSQGHAELEATHKEAADALTQMREGASEKKQKALDAAINSHLEAAKWHRIAGENYDNPVVNKMPGYSQDGTDFATRMSQTADDRTELALNIRKDATMFDELRKGDLPGHPFHGNQWTAGESGKIFDNYRPADINQTIGQIGKHNIAAISGGRVNPLRNTAGEAVGVHLPVSNGYGVNVLLHPNDTYTVQRVFTRGGVTKVKGQVEGVYAEDVGEQAYQAGMFRSNDFGGHKA